MKTERVLDQIDIEAERQAMAIKRFRQEIGTSIGQVGTPKIRAKIRCNKASTNQHHYQGAKSGIWKGMK